MFWQGIDPIKPQLAEIVPGKKFVEELQKRHHGLADRHRADADAGVVAALGDDLGRFA